MRSGREVKFKLNVTPKATLQSCDGFEIFINLFFIFLHNLLKLMAEREEKKKKESLHCADEIVSQNSQQQISWLVHSGQ